jgi:hypothetical protein
MKEVLIAIADGVAWMKVTAMQHYAQLAYKMRSMQGTTPLDMFLRGAERQEIVNAGFKCIKGK